MTVVITPGARPAPHAARNYARNPMLVYWEMTQACALACRHCRAEAMPFRHPLELTHEESLNLLRQITAFGDPLPHLILTGGDPMSRPDLFELIDAANRLGIQVSITPSATQNLTSDVIARFKEHGIQSMGLSLDGSAAEKHDAIRQVPGCFDWTIRAARLAAELDMPVQVNTLVTDETASDLPAVYELLKSTRVMRWSLFFLISVGRGKVLQEMTPEAGEELMGWIYNLSSVAPFAIKTTEAPSYRRVALNRMRASGMTSEQIRRTPVVHSSGIRDGHGIVFVSHTGAIFPSGFLPLAAGNIRSDDLAAIYRSSPLFQGLHEPSNFRGKCGECEYRAICGGSRARAYAYTGDPLESDPFCPYQPRQKGKIEAV